MVARFAILILILRCFSDRSSKLSSPILLLYDRPKRGYQCINNRCCSRCTFYCVWYTRVDPRPNNVVHSFSI